MDETISKARALVGELSSVIQEQTEEGDGLKLEELLGMNDQLLGLLKKVSGRLRHGLKLHGLGLGLGLGGEGAEVEGEVEVERDGLEGESGDGKLDGFPHINGRKGNGNGHVVEIESLSPSSSSSFSEELNSSVEGEEEKEEEEDATTPKVDKGKRKAEPEPEQPEMVLSPKTFMMGEPEREEEKRRRRGGYLDDERGVVVSPSDRCAFFCFNWDEDLMFLGRGY
jgi:protein phosphatase 1 regulatory subunit 37